MTGESLQHCAVLDYFLSLSVCHRVLILLHGLLTTVNSYHAHYKTIAELLRNLLKQMPSFEMRRVIDMIQETNSFSVETVLCFK